MTNWSALSTQIEQATGQPFSVRSEQAVGGGCINQACRIGDGEREFFVKLNSARYGDMFEVEYLSLLEMAASRTIRVPEPICYGEADGQAFLVLEYLPLAGRPDAQLQGQQLAAMHRHVGERFGWQRDNTIGSTPQYNNPGDDWVTFWREQRLLPQLKLAQQNGYGRSLGIMDKLLADFPRLFSDYQPQASMLHGDLWGGNAAALADGTPVIFDPAFYYGDRETDIAMTTLFGGFSPAFYDAYNDSWPLDAGYPSRKHLYNLYHLLNHLNLFGSGYLGQAIASAERVLAEI